MSTLQSEQPASEADIADAPVKPWASLQHSEYRLLLAGFAGNNLGTNALQVANLWQVYQLSRSALDLGLTGLFQAIPLLTLGLFGGVLADSVDRKKLIIVAQALRFVVTIALALVTHLGQVEVWHIYGVTMLYTLFGLVDRPARQSIIPNVVPRHYLFNAVALQMTSNQISRLAGPALAGVIIGVIGITNTYYAIAASSLLVILFLLMMRSTAERSEAPPKVSLNMVIEGFQFLLRSPIIMGLIILDSSLTFFGAFRTLLPIFAEEVLHVGPAELGALYGAPGLGALIGAGSVMFLGNVSYKRRLVLASTALYGLMCIPLGYSQWFWLSFLIVAALGLLDSAGATVRHTTVQLLTPDALRGRVTSAHQAFSMGAPSLGYLQIGVTASVIGASGALALGSILCIATVVGMAFWWQQAAGSSMGDAGQQSGDV